MPRSIDEFLAHADQLADAFEGYDPEDGDRGESPLMALPRVAHRRALIERELVDAGHSARAGGASWTKIGDQLGTTGQAARQRYGGRSVARR